MGIALGHGMRPELVIFDCDGVLVDSEGVASAVVARALSELGWGMTADEALALFMGMSFADMEPVIVERLGRALAPGWRDGIVEGMLAALAEQAVAVPGAREMLLAVTAMGVAWRVASNSSAAEMAVKFARCGLADLVAGRVYSAQNVARGKPAPDVFLAAAAGVAPGKCVVLEDSVLGVRGAVAAGMVCYGFAPGGDGAALIDAGAVGVLRRLEEFTGVL